MQENRKRLLKSIYTVCFSVLTVVVGLLFIVQAWSIFRSAERNAFTVARISQHFHQIVVPVAFWVLALIGNIVLGYVYPDEQERLKPYFETSERVNRLKRRLPENSLLRRRDKTDYICLAVGCAALVLAVAASVVSLVYLLDKSYAPILNESIFVESDAMTDRLVRVLVWSASGMMLLLAAVILGDTFAKKKEEKIKREIAENAVKGIRVPAAKAEKRTAKEHTKLLWIIRGGVAVVGIVCVITGICNGGMADVLKKAIQICTQCIGLG